jgi:transcriptional regulator with XRE-family HTH domain
VWYITTYISIDFCGFLSLFFRKINMKADGWTLKELAAELGIPEHTAQMRITRANIEPMFRGSIYRPDTLDKIKEAPMGRPRKQPESRAKKSEK